MTKELNYNDAHKTRKVKGFNKPIYNVVAITGVGDAKVYTCEEINYADEEAEKDDKES